MTTEAGRVAIRVVDKLWRDLCCRKGFDLDTLDKETQIDVREKWEKIVEDEVEPLAYELEELEEQCRITKR